MLPEEIVEKYLDDKVKEAGGFTRKIKYLGRVGCPDRLVVLWGFTDLVELKAPKGKLMSHQVREKLLFKKHKVLVWVLHSKEQVDRYIKNRENTLELREDKEKDDLEGFDFT